MLLVKRSVWINTLFFVYVGVYNGICGERGSENKNEMMGARESYHLPWY